MALAGLTLPVIVTDSPGVMAVFVSRRETEEVGVGGGGGGGGGAGGCRVTSIRILEDPLGTVPDADPEFEPDVALTVIASPAPLTDNVTAYLPWESVAVDPWSMGDVTVTDAPATGLPCSSLT